MSALAARRAAAASQLTQPSNTPAHTDTPVSAGAASPSPTLEEDDIIASADESDSLSSASAPPSLKRRRTTAKPSSRARYFAKEPPRAVPAATTNRQRRFSPSAPVAESDQEDGEDSSVGDSDADAPVEDIYDEAENEVDDGRAQWSLPATPAVDPTPGPSRLRGRTSAQAITNENTSTFIPVNGENILKYTENELHAAGLDDHPGPGVLLCLVKDESLMMAGAFIITPIFGGIQLFSTTLTPTNHNKDSHQVFAPVSHPLPVVTPAFSPTASQHLRNLRIPSKFQNSAHQGNSVLVLLRELRSGLDGMRYGVLPEFARIWMQEEGPWGLKGVHPIIDSFPTPVYPHMTSASWSKALEPLTSNTYHAASGVLEDVDTPLVALVKGPKRSGKSTFARALLNNLLNRYQRVAWLDCDLGQGEFGCGGVVGLWILDQPVLGPPFSHPAVPFRGHYLGTYTPLTCPDEYIAAIRHLVEHYRYNMQHNDAEDTNSDKIGSLVPLVVNTQGWVKGLGEDLLREIEAIAEASHIYAFTSPTHEEDNRHQGPGWTQSPKWETSHTLPPISTTASKTFTLDPAPVSPLQARYTAADLRVLSTITYFHSSLARVILPLSIQAGHFVTATKPVSTVSWDFSVPLAASPPWEVEYGLGKGIERVYLIGEGSDGVVENDLPIALNGSVVALMEFLDTPDDAEGKLYAQARPLPALDAVNFLGLAIVRAITHEKIHLLTPLSPSDLARCRALVKNGAIELPTPGMLDWTTGGVSEEGMAGKKWEDVPFLDVSGVEVVAGERRRFRKNIMRKGM
ncbi:hypothetical protein IAR55_002951 [Kwoniella newhampshirensis]|uniref:Polynucleotide 5'-hydroxyl-kinase GRC3 n=1 Tax=Kwoniella newhampshirensis TaxID=1651941 RepID=A0AAW0Z099_9TREE